MRFVEIVTTIVRSAVRVVSVLAALVPLFCFSSDARAQVTVMGPITSVLASRIQRQMAAAPVGESSNGSILLQGATLLALTEKQRDVIRATYLNGFTVVLLDPTMQQIKILHELVGEGVTYRSISQGVLHMYALRRENNIPTAVLLHTRTQTGATEEPPGLNDLLLDQAAQRVISELNHAPKLKATLPRDPGQPVAWQDNPIQISTLTQNNSGGVYNTVFSVYALHECLDNTDHYVVTALADWTATNAHFQSAGWADGSIGYDSNGNLRVNWENNGQNPNVPFCGAGFFKDDSRCQYVNYPLSYVVSMLPPNTGTVIQINAAPPATQGETTTYTSGFMFNIGGMVNMSGVGLTGGATWTNTTATTVPALDLLVSNQGNQGAEWQFEYCTTGDEPGSSPHGTCTWHVQTAQGLRLQSGGHHRD